MEGHAVETGEPIDENSASGVKLAKGFLQIYPFFIMRNRKVTLETLLFSAYSVSASASASTRDPR